MGKPQDSSHDARASRVSAALTTVPQTLRERASLKEKTRVSAVLTTETASEGAASAVLPHYGTGSPMPYFPN
ncbi:hypothetical protein NIES4103_11070 [Nostoc sp. NIES-4103]|nr:hypothetical protein NIES4103_11070 [Nostoc sp. NIES-4103]